MHVLVTGASGIAGRFITRKLLDAGCEITVLGRKPLNDWSAGFIRYDLVGAVPELPRADALVHCALQHLPGKYRDGEGDDPHGFIKANLEGTQRLFETAKSAGVRRCVFLSSRAVYADTGNWSVLTETSGTHPDTLYGKIKLAGEEALKSLCDEVFLGTVLRSTGIYGVPPGGSQHKWSDIFDRFEHGQAVSPRLGTEVHGKDLAEAADLLLRRQDQDVKPFEIFNVSDLLLDRQDLLKSYARIKSISNDLPARADGPLGVMDCGKLKLLGWRPGGNERLREFLESC